MFECVQACKHFHWSTAAHAYTWLLPTTEAEGSSGDMYVTLSVLRENTIYLYFSHFQGKKKLVF